MDFFRFIDVTGHPFSGTGNLAKFAEGLVKIDIQNQILFVLDNDAEGLEAYRRLQRLVLPNNMRGVMLPELEVFKAFRAMGPAKDIVTSVHDLELGNIGVARYTPDTQDNLALLRTPKGAPTPDRQERSLKQILA